MESIAARPSAFFSDPARHRNRSHRCRCEALAGVPSKDAKLEDDLPDLSWPTAGCRSARYWAMPSVMASDADGGSRSLKPATIFTCLHRYRDATAWVHGSAQTRGLRSGPDGLQSILSSRPGKARPLTIPANALFIAKPYVGRNVVAAMRTLKTFRIDAPFKAISANRTIDREMWVRPSPGRAFLRERFAAPTAPAARVGVLPACIRWLPPHVPPRHKWLGFVPLC